MITSLTKTIMNMFDMNCNKKRKTKRENKNKKGTKYIVM